MAVPLQIRPFEPADWPGVWQVLEPVFRAGDTFPHDPAISEAEARILWVEHTRAVMVALDAAGHRQSSLPALTAGGPKAW